MLKLNDIINLSKIPSEGQKEWLADAESAVNFVVTNAGSDEIILYASLSHVLIYGVLASLAAVTPPDADDLLQCMIFEDLTWTIEHSSGGGEPDKVYLAPPFNAPGCKSLHLSEMLVFRRSFDGVDSGVPRTEVSQKLVHGLGLYWMDENQAFCRLNEEGDIESIIRVRNLTKETNGNRDLLVTISSGDLHRYMAVTQTALVQKFDFTRMSSGAFVGWSQKVKRVYRNDSLFYNFDAGNNASYANGIHIVRPQLTPDEIINKFNLRWNDNDKQYATFKAQDWKNNRLAEISCAPEALASYFEKDSVLPFQITPAFFRPEVLQKYKADPEKYTLEHRSITSRAGWHLKTYDVNDAGQVHTYLWYLGNLPYSEQLYWLAFNEWPKAPISERAFRTDFKADWDVTFDALQKLKFRIGELDKSKPEWWEVRGKSMSAAVHYPLTTSPEDWSNELLALDQLIVEGFLLKPIRARLRKLKRPFEDDWGTLRLIEELLVALGVADPKGVIEPLKQLHFLRTKVKGHATKEKQQLIKDARSQHGSLKQHFVSLVTDCDRTFEHIAAALSNNGE